MSKVALSNQILSKQPVTQQDGVGGCGSMLGGGIEMSREDGIFI